MAYENISYFEAKEKVTFGNKGQHSQQKGERHNGSPVATYAAIVTFRSQIKGLLQHILNQQEIQECGTIRKLKSHRILKQEKHRLRSPRVLAETGLVLAGKILWRNRRSSGEGSLTGRSRLLM